MKTRKSKPSAASLLAALLAVAGLAVLLYPTLSDRLTRWQISRELQRYNTVLDAQAADYSAQWAEAEAYNRALPQQPNHLFPTSKEREDACHLLNPNGSNILGRVTIPSIDVDLPIYRGTEEKQLQSGAGWWIGSSLPTGGAGTHCVLTAHTGLAKARLFTDLDQLETGDRFTLTVLDRVMTYEVDQILITEPDDVNALQIVEGQDYVTLYTCTPYGINTHRLLVRGRRVADAAETAALEHVAAPPAPWLVPAAFVWMAVLLAVFAAGVIRPARKPRERK